MRVRERERERVMLYSLNVRRYAMYEGVGHVCVCACHVYVSWNCFMVVKG